MNKNEMLKMVCAHKVAEVFEPLYNAALVDDEARAVLLAVLRSSCSMYLLQEHEDMMCREAHGGCALMQYVWGRYLYIVRADSSSKEEAKTMLQDAAAAGVADARSCLSCWWRDGESGVVDREKYIVELERAIAEGSQLALQLRMEAMIYGYAGVERDPRAAFDELERYIDEAERGDGYMDPRFYLYLAHAAKETGRDTLSASLYKKAFDEGVPEACLPLLLVTACDSEGKVIDKTTFNDIVTRGMERNYGEAFVYHMFSVSEDDYAAMSPEAQRKTTEEMTAMMTEAARLGEPLGAYMMADNHYYGSYGFEQDCEKAWSWYSVAAMQRLGLAYWALSQMIAAHDAPKNYDMEFMHECELRALRYGCDDALANVVIAHTQGYLKDYTEEIDRYYAPIFDAEEEDRHKNGGDNADDDEDFPYDDDDSPDDDGRFDPYV